MNKQKPELGQTLYSLNVGNAARWKTQTLTPVTVVKIGRKYFFCSEKGLEGRPRCWTKYQLDDWRQVTEISANSELYISELEYEEGKEKNILFDKIRRSFDYFLSANKFTLNQLREINEIIEGNDVKQS